MVVGNPAAQSVSASLQYFTKTVSFASDLRSSGDSFYRPLFWLSLGLDASVWGLNPVGFHVTDLVLHWLNGVVLFFILRRLRFSHALSLLTVVVWLGLPIHSEAVAWIAGRSYSLSTFFLLAALLCGQRYLSTRSGLAFGGYLLGAVCALFSHEQGILLLPLLALLAAVERAERSRGAVLLYSGALGVDVFYLAVAHRVGASVVHHFGALSSMALYWVKYIWWVLFPLHMSIERSTDAPVAGWSLKAVAAFLAVGVVVGLVAFFVRSAPSVRLGLAWLFVCLLPFSGVVVIYQGMAERFAYLASVGLALCLCSLCLSLAPNVRTVALAGLVVWAAWGAVRLQLRLSDWRDPARLYESSLKATPRSLKLHYNLGAFWEEDGRFGEALNNYQDALQIDSNYEPAIAGEGNAYLQLNQPEQARQMFERALLLKRDDVKTINNYGLSLQRLGRVNDAKLQYLRAIGLAPTDDTAYCSLAVLFFRAGASDVAEMLFKKAILVNQTDPLPYSNLAEIYAKSGRVAMALPLYRKVLELDPGDSSALAALQSLSSAR